MPDSGLILGLPIKDGKVYNVPLPLKNTEYAYTLPSGVREFTIRSRSGLKVQLAFEAGKSGTEFLSVNSTWTEQNVDPSDTTTLYMRGAKSGDVVEILTWK